MFRIEEPKLFEIVEKPPIQGEENSFKITNKKCIKIVENLESKDYLNTREHVKHFLEHHLKKNGNFNNGIIDTASNFV